MKKASQLRYCLMPYIYSTAASVWHSDNTMMKLLAFDFPQDQKVWNIKDQYLFGESLMVCPITEPMYYDKGSVPIRDADFSREVYLPEGVEWYDFWTKEKYQGGQTIKASAELSKIPVFVKAGSIIPMGPNLNHANETTSEPLELHIYPGKTTETLFYQDSGDSYDYEKGEYQLLKWIWQTESQELITEIRHSHPNIPLPAFKISIYS
jgi:alpha-D-xyloside xylohydrolase